MREEGGQCGPGQAAGWRCLRSPEGSLGNSRSCPGLHSHGSDQSLSRRLNHEPWSCELQHSSKATCNYWLKTPLLVHGSEALQRALGVCFLFCFLINLFRKQSGPAVRDQPHMAMRRTGIQLPKGAKSEDIG